MAAAATSSSDDSDVRNMALMFFLDHLMQKNGHRSIHDLSCQFGARGFTPAMRAAVGGTKESLGEFLAQYPSLFTVEADMVKLNGHLGDVGGSNGAGGTGGAGSNGGSNASLLMERFVHDRNVVQEAIKFFEEKLLKFGPELQIKSLLGHRSQASPEIRLVSGRHMKDFVDFLSGHPDKFAIDGDRVSLKDAPEPATVQQDLDDAGQPVTGQAAEALVVDYLKTYLLGQEAPVPMETLYKTFYNRFSHDVRKSIATNPKELLRFLKSNRQTFFIRSNKISIVHNRSSLSDRYGSGNGRPSSATATDDGQNSGSLLNGVSSGGGGRVSSRSSDTDDASYGTEPSSSTPRQPQQQPVLLKSLKAAQEAVQHIWNVCVQSAHSRNDTTANVVAVDFKLIALDAQEFLTLIVVSTASRHSFVFDVSNSASILLESGLKDLLECEDYIKVVHDCRKPSIILREQYHIQIREVFDTQIAYHLIQQQESERTVPFGPLKQLNLLSIPFAQLQQVYDPVGFANRLQPPPTWSTRPVTDEVLSVASEQALSLLPTIYRRINRLLSPKCMGRFYRLCQESVTAPSNAMSPIPDKMHPRYIDEGLFHPVKNDKFASFAQRRALPRGCCCECHLKLETRDMACQT